MPVLRGRLLVFHPNNLGTPATTEPPTTVCEATSEEPPPTVKTVKPSDDSTRRASWRNRASRRNGDGGTLSEWGNRRNRYHPSIPLTLSPLPVIGLVLGT